eukprot:TRINITY_DN1329_c0_g1_i1.p1 TRINITY_DN1329_c0_g1~~TRINITY_DN1329_c0_g1_i1.p1  ORF type:complete len:773 (+),score=105.22 TRINITY_DN1329_c0_g1_i1:1326-3644(+)
MEQVPHHTINIEQHNMKVDFPYKPYKVQEEYAKCVVNACENKQNAMLESPTGSGKTVTLLCSARAWCDKQEKLQMGKRPIIIYASRTHSQLDQVRKELLKISKPVSAITIGSREKYCLYYKECSEETKNKHDDIEDFCKWERKHKTCPYFFNIKDVPEELKEKFQTSPADVVEKCKEASVCPYFFAKEMAKEAQLILLPYDYLTRPEIQFVKRGLVSPEGQSRFTGSVVIFDEAHNIQNSSEQGNGLSVTLSKLSNYDKELMKILEMKKEHEVYEEEDKNLAKTLNDVSEYDVERIVWPIKNFCEHLKNAKPTIFGDESVYEVFSRFTKKFPAPDNPSESFAPKGMDDFDNGITLDNFRKYLELVEKCKKVLKRIKGRPKIGGWGWTIRRIYEYAIKAVDVSKKKLPEFSTYEGNINDFKAVITEDKEAAKKPIVQVPMKLEIYCFNPGIGLADLINSRPNSIILTSGTLTPMEPLVKELRIPFDIKLENDHVIDKSQVCLLTVGEIANPYDIFRFTKSRKDSEKGKVQFENVKNFIREISEVSPGGTLVFYTSYQDLAICTAGVNPGSKRIFIESKKKDLKKELREFTKTAIEKGALLHAVMRGSISEGLDFSDQAARVAVVVGVPYANLKDERIILKKEYVDKWRKFLGLTGQEWYKQDAIRVVNQAIGRVIRHKDDYGALILVDHRYSEKDKNALMSKWVRKEIPMSITAEECIEKLKKFFKAQEDRNPKSLVPAKKRMLPEAPEEEGKGDNLSKEIREHWANMQALHL